jgi:hypothetical protein
MIPRYIHLRTGAIWYDTQGDPPYGEPFKPINLDGTIRGEMKMIAPFTYRLKDGRQVGVEIDPRLSAALMREEGTGEYACKDDGMVGLATRATVSWKGRQPHPTRGWVDGKEIIAGEIVQ